MQPKTRHKLGARVSSAAEAALAAQGYVSCIDILCGIGWVDHGTVERWRRGQIDYLERVVQANLARISEAMKLFRAWAKARDLYASETDYVARTPQRRMLQFSRSGDPTIERLYRTHWISPKLSENKRRKLVEKAAVPPQLVVVEPLNREWQCHRCGQTGNLLIMENPGPACLHCVGLADLEFLPSGDTLLTRRAKAKSKRSAVVVRFSRNRHRYERQGLLVEPEALAEAKREMPPS